jgi:hypothetical protein
MARIGDAERGALGTSPPPKPSSSLAGLAAQLSSPLAITIIVPGLVAIVGLVLVAIAAGALRASTLAVARDGLAATSRLVAGTIDDALSEADPLLARMEPLVRSRSEDAPLDELAIALLDLASVRVGVTYLSVSFPDGTFEGVYRDTDGVWRFQDSRIDGDATRVRRYDFDGRAIRLRLEERTHYDPRTREFYRTAVARGAPAWTEPYTFFGSHATGVTRTAPLFVDGALRAVLTVDFDVHALSTALRSRPVAGTRALLYSPSGVILAHAAEDARGDDAVREARTLRAADLHDPAIDAFFAQVGADAPAPRVEEVRVDGERWLGAITPTSEALGLGWGTVYLAPESLFLASLDAYTTDSILVEALAVALAMLVAFLFARHVTKVRAEVVTAREEAKAARKDARELGSYRLVSQLGKGGMGEVWRAEHRLLAREAAIKLITPREGVVSDALKLRFRREAEALAKLCSRNTIELFDFGVSDDGTFFFVMELLDGEDLETLVAKHGKLPPARVVHFLVQALRSLAEAHEAGLVHRDIKPANLYACRAADEVDLVKVLDFGLVRVGKRAEPALDEEQAATLRSLSGSSGGGLDTVGDGSLGTPAFMPPEQALGDPVDARADLYALAGVAYWLLSGKLLFERDTPFALILAHLSDPIPDLRAELPTDVPDALVAILVRCLAKSRDGRPKSAREVLDVLTEIEFESAEAWTHARAAAWWRTEMPRPAVHP